MTHSANESDREGREACDARDTPGDAPESPGSVAVSVARRTVLGALAAAGAAGALTGPTGADASAATDESPSLAADDDAPPGTDALLAYVEVNYGDRLSDERLDAIRADVAADLRAAAAVDDVELDYTVGPAFEFRPYRGGE
ncbi:hypothetical protein [Halegenticoccus soli]|uniref:hypothetical protein n=1 Tax=Halegenticoccus soli TaxID=1985678 RepID=UPI00117B815E|nr:hypothetical protein [Halegenticoccus soli]